jgi:hypothetical protein
MEETDVFLNINEHCIAMWDYVKQIDDPNVWASWCNFHTIYAKYRQDYIERERNRIVQTRIEMEG